MAVPSPTRRWASLLPALFVLPFTAFASQCLLYEKPETCNKYTDSGSCTWDSSLGVCVAGPSLPQGTVAVADAPLNPGTYPFQLKPGPSASEGTVSLGKPTNVPSFIPKDLAINSTAANGTRKILANQDSRGRPQAYGIDICILNADSGPCRAYIPRWFYNKTEGSCQNFVYGGCGGNANNFMSPEACANATKRC